MLCYKRMKDERVRGEERGDETRLDKTCFIKTRGKIEYMTNKIVK